MCQKTGSSDNYRFTMDNATIDNIASTIANCGIVLIHTHGATDYNNGNGDRTSRANTSYMTVKTSAGLTSADVAKHYGEFGYYYDCLYSEGYARFNGECIAKHMPKNAPSSFVYLGMCLGMATDGLCTPLRNKGVEALMGFSQIVRISTDYRYMQCIADCLIQGTSLSYAVQQSKENVGYWDPALKRDTLEEAREARAAFPIVASSEDPYPGHGNADDYQTVNSTWKINKNLNFSGDAVINTEALVTDELSVTLTGNAGYFSDSELTFQWQQYYPPSGGSSGFWGNISGATGRKYTCSSGLAGKYIHVVVKAPGYSGQITSNYCYISGSVLLSSDNFPDAVFRNYLSSNFDKDHDGSLSVDPEITAIRKIDLSYTNAASLVGLRYLVNVTEVNANGAGITSFDGTGSPKLRVLKLYNCPLGSLDLNDNPNLTEVNVSGPNVQLSTLDLSGHRNLLQLYTSRSGIGTIDISDCPLLTEAALYGEKQTVTIGGVEGINYQSWNSGKEAYLSISGGSSEPRIYVAHFDKAFPSAAFRTIAADTCGDYDGRLDLWEANGVADLYADHREEGITSLQGIEFFPNLYQLSAKDCRIEYVDLSSNHRLTDVDLSENSLVELDVSHLANLENLYLNDNKLYYIDVSENPALRTLQVAKNDLIKVDVSHNPILYTLDISENDIDEIDISMLPELQYLYFGKTKIAEIDLSENTDLYYLDCIGAEKLKKLNVTDNEALEKLFVQGSALKSLNLSENPLLSTVKCYSTQISRLDISNNPRLISAYQGSYSVKVDSDLHTAYYEYTGGSISECLAVDFHTGIATKDIRTAYISSIADKTYTGSAIRPAVDVFWDGYELTKGTDYKVTYSNNINAGTATVKVTGLNDYAGSLSRTFKIRPKKVTPKVTLSPAACTWNGNVRKPGVKVTAGSTTLVKNTDYTVTYAAGRKNVGTYKVTVKLTGNYSGSGTASFKINPKGTMVGSLTALTGGIKVKWTPQTASMSKSKVGGYQIQFATDSAFTANKKTTTVTGYKRASLKKTGLKSGKKYYVRIRTFKKVDGKTYYSSWSKARTVKTK